jgi:ureidoacrylate peracid hydrolase
MTVLSTTVASPTTGRVVTIEAKPGPLRIDTRETAVLVVDMQNDFGAEGGMFHRAGIDISPASSERATALWR